LSKHPQGKKEDIHINAILKILKGEEKTVK